jgi:hypothetical protein
VIGGTKTTQRLIPSSRNFLWEVKCEVDRCSPLKPPVFPFPKGKDGARRVTVLLRSTAGQLVGTVAGRDCRWRHYSRIRSARATPTSADGQRQCTTRTMDARGQKRVKRAALSISAADRWPSTSQGPDDRVPSASASMPSLDRRLNIENRRAMPSEAFKWVFHSPSWLHMLR